MGTSAALETLHETHKEPIYHLYVNVCMCVCMYVCGCVCKYVCVDVCLNAARS